MKVYGVTSIGNRWKYRKAQAGLSRFAIRFSRTRCGTIHRTPVGEVIGWGRSLESAIEMCRDVADSIDGYDLKINTSALDEAAEQIAKAADYGVEIKPS